MKLRVLGSSSSGNCYLLESETECLIVEAGISFLEVKKALNFNISKIVGLIISHEHGDHAKFAMEYLKAGLMVLCSNGTQEKISTKILQPLHCFHGQKFSLKNFEIMPFDIIHDAAQPFGFIIKHPDCGKVLFLTDTYYCEYTFKGLNQIIVEANYSDEILQSNIDSGRVHSGMRQRLETSHMSLKTTKELLKANDLTQARNIVLIHLSSGNSNAKQFQSEVESITGIPTTIADKGIEVNFSLNSF